MPVTQILREFHSFFLNLDNTRMTILSEQLLLITLIDNPLCCSHSFTSACKCLGKNLGYNHNSGFMIWIQFSEYFNLKFEGTMQNKVHFLCIKQKQKMSKIFMDIGLILQIKCTTGTPIEFSIYRNRVHFMYSGLKCSPIFIMQLCNYI